MNPQIASSAISAGAGIATGALSMLGQRRREKRAMKNQQKLMGIQYQHQKDLNRQGSDLQYEMWKKTNYPAQMGMLKEAGLNPALLYGMSGGGGTTTGNQGGGSAASGNAPAPQPMELGTALQAAMTQANIKLAESQAKKNEAEATKISGVDTDEATTRIASLTQGIENLKAEEELKTVQTKMTSVLTRIQEATSSDQIDQAMWNVKRQIYETYAIGLENKVNEKTIDEKVNIIKNESIASGLANILTKAQIGKTKEEILAISQSILQRWKEIKISGDKVDIERFKAEIKAEYPSLNEAGGKMVNAGIGFLEYWEEKLTGAKPYRRRVNDNKVTPKGGW